MANAVTSQNAPEPRGPYPHLRSDGDYVWVTGQIGRDPSTGGFVSGGFEPEFHQAITNVEHILEEVGLDLSDVVHACVQFVTEDDLDSMNRIYSERFREPYPARTSFGVAFLWKGAQVQIDAVARHRSQP
jgi:2-iminobutanoate/2-iminopropanoate deaminase